MQQKYLILGIRQPITLLGMGYKILGSLPAMKAVNKKAFGARVTQKREALGISQTILAVRVGMKQQGIANIESGLVARPRMLGELAQALNTTGEWLLWEDGPAHVAPKPPSIAQVPLISSVTAGRLVDRQSQIPVEDVPLLAFADLGSGDFFALRVEGDSMDRLVPDGSIIVVNRADRVLVPDKAYVFMCRGETTFKLWRPDPPQFAPHSWNGSHRPFYIKGKHDVEVIGRVRRAVLDL
jgi:SOS-response transcriptional repressor LexA